MKIEYLCKFPQYIELVSEWIYSEFVIKSGSSMTLTQVKHYFKNTNSDKLPITLIAIIDEKCVGTISIFKNDLKTRQDLSPWLASLYVSSLYRGKGIGKKLILEVQAMVKELGYDAVYLRTEETSEYYIKNGWKYIIETVDEKGKKTDIFMLNVQNDL